MEIKILKKPIKKSELLEMAKEGFGIEFDSMVNLKPHFGNRSRDVESQEIRDKIKKIVKKLIVD